MQSGGRVCGCGIIIIVGCMKTELPKLKSVIIKTQIGEMLLKDYYNHQQTAYDQIYFRTANPEGIAKIYELEEAASQERFNNESEQYTHLAFPILYSRVHSEKFSLKSKKHEQQFGLLHFAKLDSFPSLADGLASADGLPRAELISLAVSLIELLVQLQESRQIMCSIRPCNLYKLYDRYALVNCQFLRSQGDRNDMDSFMLETIENNWQYWPPELSDAYLNENFDYTLDVYAAGCLLYVCAEGTYPFDSKLSAANHQVRPGTRNDYLGKVINSFIGNSQVRRSLNLKQILSLLKQKSGYEPRLGGGMGNGGEERPMKRSMVLGEEKGTMKKSGLLDNISSVFSKMMNDSEGWFLNYVEEDEKAPNEKYLDNILAKMYKKEEKADKLSGIINKFISNSANAGRVNSARKCLLLIGQAVRKGPQAALHSLAPNLSAIRTKFGQSSDIDSFGALLVKKSDVNEKLKRVLAGNFYLGDISNFRLLGISDLACLVSYLQSLIGFVSTKRNSDWLDITQAIVNFCCDQIYDLVSMTIMSIISIRKDNELQLRADNLQELQPIEKAMNVCLRKLSDVSNFISAHAIYSLEGEYISYQEQIMLKSNPYYSTLQYFYYNSRTYKGLTLPTDYAQVFTKDDKKDDKKTALSASKEPKRKDYIKEDINSEDEEDFRKIKIQTESPQKLFMANTERKEEKSAINLKVVAAKGRGANLSFLDFEESLSKNRSQQSFGRVQKNESTISFEQFGNIHKNTSKASKSVSPSGDFNNFFNFNDNNPKKPPLPNLKEKASPLPLHAKNKFTEFDELFNKGVTERSSKETVARNNKEAVDRANKKVEFALPKDMYQVAPSFQVFNALGAPLSFPPPPNFPEPENPLLGRILEDLKLKELKDLILKNKGIIINFGDLKIEKAIGSGSAGEVFFGRFKGQEVAIKRVKAKQNPNALKEFQRELVTYIKIQSNPHLVSLVGLSQSNGDFYLITEFCSCGSLFELLHKKKLEIVLTWKERLSFALEIAQGVEFLHLMKPIIIHRDLKSLNVFVARKDSSYKMKVADFGLSRSPEADMMTTQLGTIHWMAPELLEGKQYSFKVDVYSYGILLWEILARTTPYSNLHNPMAILKYVVMDRQRPNVDLIPKECPPQLIQVMQKCWAHEPNDRPPFSEVIRMLRGITL